MASKTTKKAQNGAAPEEAVISIPRLELRELDITLVGDSPLIMHRWSEKAKEQMRRKQSKQASTGREPKDPHAEYEASIYRLGDGYGFPAVAFKAAAVAACRYVNQDIKMTQARGAFHVLGEMVPIEGEPQMREDMVRVGSGVADLRYRAEFGEWSAVLTIRYNAHALSPAQIINLFNIAGFGVGVGEWRPEKDGSYGRFHVKTED